MLKINNTAQVRSLFPALQLQDTEQVFPIYFDGPGGTQMVQTSVDRMVEYISTGMANLHGSFPTSIKTDALLEEAKSAVADLLHCQSQEIAFGQNMTSLAFKISESFRDLLREGDEILVTELDHRANVDPWLHLAKQTGAIVKFIPVDKEKMTLDLSVLDDLLSEKTRLVAVGLASNLTGTISDIQEIFKRAEAFEALKVVDAVHAVPHIPVDFEELGCDVLFCSAYKFFGPHLGIAVLKAPLFEKLKVAKLQPGPDEIPYKLETGTQNHEGIAGLCGAIDFIGQFGEGTNRRQRLLTGMTRIEDYENQLADELEHFLKNIPQVRLYRAPAPIRKTPTFSFKIKGINSRDASRFLAKKHNLCIGDGHFYASTMAEVFPVMEEGGWMRIGLAPYNTLAEIDIFKKALIDLIEVYAAKT